MLLGTRRVNRTPSCDITISSATVAIAAALEVDQPRATNELVYTVDT